jgi:hypothetical protein
VRKLPRVLILWGVPGVGKSTFADWLVNEKKYAHIDTDAQGAGASRAARAWRFVLAALGTPAQYPSAKEFMKLALYNPTPVVLEYGMFAVPDAMGLLGVLRDGGAEAWFDGDRHAAFEAWKAENLKPAGTSPTKSGNR